MGVDRRAIGARTRDVTRHRATRRPGFQAYKRDIAEPRTIEWKSHEQSETPSGIAHLCNIRSESGNDEGVCRRRLRTYTRKDRFQLGDSVIRLPPIPHVLRVAQHFRAARSEDPIPNTSDHRMRRRSDNLEQRRTFRRTTRGSGWDQPHSGCPPEGRAVLPKGIRNLTCESQQGSARPTACGILAGHSPCATSAGSITFQPDSGCFAASSMRKAREWHADAPGARDLT
jgi:hypothetical protein